MDQTPPSPPPLPPPPGSDLAPPGAPRSTGPQQPGRQYDAPRTLKAARARSVARPRSVTDLRLQALSIPQTLDAAMRLIRDRPGPLIGTGLVGASLVVLLPYAVTALTGLLSTADRGIEDGASGGPGTFLLDQLVFWVGLAAVTVVATPIALSTLLGRPATLGEAYRGLRGHRRTLLGVGLLCLGFWALALGVPTVAFLVLDRALPLLLAVPLTLGVLLLWAPPAIWIWARQIRLAIPVACTETGGVRRVLARARHLSRGSAWRLIGGATASALLGYLVTIVVLFPFIVAAELVEGATSGAARYWTSTGLEVAGSLVGSTYLLAFLASVGALQYADRRIRREGWGLIR